MSGIIRLGDAMPFLQKTSQESMAALVSRRSDDLVKHITVVIDDARQPLFLADDGDDHLVQMPNVVPARLL